MLMKIRKTLKRKDNQKGFTLVELIIVMAILAILAAIAVPRFGASLDKAEKQAHNANVMMLEKAAELYVLNGEEIPAGGDITQSLKSGYIVEVPAVPHDSTKEYTVVVEEVPGDITNQVKVTVTPEKVEI